MNVFSQLDFKFHFVFSIYKQMMGKLLKEQQGLPKSCIWIKVFGSIYIEVDRPST